MKVTREKTENSQAFLTIEMEPSEVEKSVKEAYHRLVRKADIPGFRKGKAPRAILERYVGRESLFEDALKHLIPQACENAIKEQKIEAFAYPSIEIAKTDPVVFKATVPLPPTIELDDYHHIQVMPEPAEPVTEDNINAVIEQLRHQNATWEPAERPVGFNDSVAFDVESSIEGESFINQKGAQYQVIEGLSFPVTGFAEQLVGMQRNEEKEFKLKCPSDYPKKELAEKEASFKVKVIEIKQERLPKLTNDFAKAVSPDFKTLNSLRKRISADLKFRADEKTRADFEEKVIEAAVNLAQVEFPPIMIEVEIDRLLSQRLRRWQTGDRGLEEYLASINKTEKEIREELCPLATMRVTRSLVLGKVAQEEKIEVSGSEIDAEVENATRGATEKKDELQKLLNTPQSRESIEQLLIARKTIQRLVEIAKDSNIEVV